LQAKNVAGPRSPDGQARQDGVHRMDHASEYSSKLVPAAEAVRVVRPGDWVQYGHHANAPVYLDGFLARRKDELGDVKLCAVVFPGLAQVATCDPPTWQLRAAGLPGAYR